MKDKNQLIEEKIQCLRKRYPGSSDPWGLDLNAVHRDLKLLYPIYKKYFKVRLIGAEKIQDQPYIVVANHGGQLPIDAMMLAASFVLELERPRILRGMVERFLAGFPFLGAISAKSGSVLGDRINARYLLEKGESLMVFPEGVKGISKNTKDFYQLQHFTRGFYRIAADTKTPILPIAIVGAEEFYPQVYQAKKIAKALKLPAFPITPSFPFFGALGVIPRPSPIDIYIGDPIEVPKNLDPESPDHVIDCHVNEVKKSIQKMIHLGLKKRRAFDPRWSTQIKKLIKGLKG